MKASLRLVGYWHSEFDATPWPDPRHFVDPAWDRSTRDMVIDYLVRGHTLKRYRGLSPCRFCGAHVGSKELTDRTYCWPEGLAHYLTEHAVRLPNEFVSHIEAVVAVTGPAQDLAPTFDHLGQRLQGDNYEAEYQAWTSSAAQRFQQDDASRRRPPNWLDAEVTYDWWLHQAGWAPRQQDDDTCAPVAKDLGE